LLIEDLEIFWERMASESVKFAATAKEIRKQIIKTILSLFTIRISDKHRKEKIDILTRSPAPWIVELEDSSLILDFRNFHHALDNFINESFVNSGEQIGNIVRDAFPELCWTQIKLGNKSASKLWRVNRNLSVNGSKRECDLAFLI